jgi:hypothetical protein
MQTNSVRIASAGNRIFAYPCPPWTSEPTIIYEQDDVIGELPDRGSVVVRTTGIPDSISNSRFQMLRAIFEWFIALPGQGQAALAAAFVSGICGIVAASVKGFKVTLGVLSGVLLVVSLMGISGWSARFDLATQTSTVAVIVPRGILLEGDKDDLLLRSKKEVFCIGATMFYTFNNRKQAILQKLREGVTIRVLIASPDGQAYPRNAEMFGQSVAELQRESTMTIEGFRAVMRDWEKIRSTIPEASRGQCIVKTVDSVFPTGFYFYDVGTESPLDMLMVPHVMGQDSPEIPGYRIPIQQKAIIKYYYDSFRKAWDAGTELSPISPAT